MFLLLTTLALADVAPPEDYVETCTTAIQCGPEIEGATCERVLSREDPMEACHPLEEKGWTEMCSSWGGTISDVVFCAEQPDEAARSARIAKATAEGASSWACATVPLAAGGSLLVAALFFRRRP